MQGHYKKARSWAIQHHAGQTTKAGLDYFEHHIEPVVKIVREQLGGGYAEAIVAYLHDIVEDTTVTLDDVEADFGPDIRDAVDALTRRDGETYADFIGRVITVGGMAKLVKTADVIDHLVDTSALPDSMVKRYTKALARLTA